MLGKKGVIKMTKMSKKFIFLSLMINCAISIVHSQVFWNECTSPVSTALRCVSNIDAFNAWVCGASGVVLKTSDGGYNWINVSGSGIPNTVTLINIYGINSTNALTAGYSGSNTFVYRTTNGGTNWTQVFTEANGFINAVWMQNANTGFIQGDPVSTRWSLWKTTNGGVNWDSTGLYLARIGSEAGWNSSMSVINNKIWFGTNNTRIYYSSNSGLNWMIQSTAPELNSYSMTIEPVLQLTGFMGGTNMLKTTNGGTNWTPVTVPATGNFSGFAINTSASPYAWLVRSTNSIYYAFLPYTSWSVQYTAPAGTYHHISASRTNFLGPGFLYAVRSNGGISRGNLFIEGVKIISNEIPADYKLYQNYPNPFNPSTKIKFHLDSWDGSDFPSGIYYYQLSVVDPKYNTVEFRETKKMVLVK
jgi:photosystem II stability/assembly factor-like uncharacterized protein